MTSRVDPVDLAADHRSWRELVLERDLESSWDVARLPGRRLSHELLEITLETRLELAPLELVRVEPDPARDRLGYAPANEPDRLFDVRLRDALGTGKLLRECLVEALQCDVEHASAQHPIDRAVDLSGPEVALEEPGGRARCHSLQIGHRPGLTAA